jgi:RimJ/RimL family protein N-acetyltransferase
MVTLRRMTDQQYATFLARSIQERAAQMVQVGGWTAAEAVERSRREHLTLLSSGPLTLNHFLFAIELDGECVGDVWLRVYHHSGGAEGYLFRFTVGERYRRRGVASRAMELLMEEMTRIGVTRLSIHLFAENEAGMAFFLSVGFLDVTLGPSIVKMSRALPRAKTAGPQRR